MPDIWFFETPGPDGKWQPNVAFGDKPTPIMAEGKRRRFSKEPVKISEAEYEGYSLDNLQLRHGLDAPITTYEEPMPHMDETLEEVAESVEHKRLNLGDATPKEELENYSDYANDGIATLQEVFRYLPDGHAKNMAAMFFDTSVLWMQRAFIEAKEKLKP